MNVSLDGVDPPGLVATVVVEVPGGLHQVDLATGREGPVGVVLRQEPDGRADPVSPGQASPHLHTPVTETELGLQGSQVGSEIRIKTKYCNSRLMCKKRVMSFCKARS